MRDYVVVEDVKTRHFDLRKGMTVPGKFTRPTVLPGFRESMKRILGKDILMLKSEYLKLPNIGPDGEVEKLKAENALLKSELRKLQRRNPDEVRP